MTKIGDLPEDMARLILVSSRNAARLSNQSKYFRNIYTIIPHLEYDFSKIQTTDSFIDGVVSSLPLHSTRVGKFTLRSGMDLDHVKINELICHVLNLGVEYLELWIDGREGYVLPSEVFTSKTIIRLKIGGEDFVIRELPQNASLPKLETLVLKSIRFYGNPVCAFDKLLSASPALKELTIDGICWELGQWSERLYSQSLERLAIVRSIYNNDGNAWPASKTITFDTPNLAYLELLVAGATEYTLPSEFFTSRNLVTLKIGYNFVIKPLPHNASCPKLETLILRSVRFYGDPDSCALNKLLSASPALKELAIDRIRWELSKWSGRLSSHSLQRLRIMRSMYDADGYDLSNYKRISFDMPSLLYLDCCDAVPDEYPEVHFNNLVAATLNLQLLVEHRWKEFPDDKDVITSNPTNLIQGLSTIKILVLTAAATYETLYFFRRAIPLFVHLVDLTMVHDEPEVCWRFFPFLIAKTPNLKKLVIKGGFHYDEKSVEDVCACLDGYSCLLSCPVEVLEINIWDNGNPRELMQVEHFLGKLSSLELVRVDLSRTLSAMDNLAITTHLQAVPTASPKCQIIFR